MDETEIVKEAMRDFPDKSPDELCRLLRGLEVIGHLTNDEIKEIIEKEKKGE